MLCTLDPERRYRVALEGHVPERGQGRSMFLSGQRETLPYRITDVPFRAALYAHAVRSGRIEAAPEGRVQGGRRMVGRAASPGLFSLTGASIYMDGQDRQDGYGGVSLIPRERGRFLLARG